MIQTEPFVKDNTARSQVVERVALILTELSCNGNQGSRLKDLALETGIARPSVHRLLGELIRVGFVIQKSDRTYALGPNLFTLSLSAPSPIQDIKAIQDFAQELADSCGDVVYVALRQFNGVHYVIRAEGVFTHSYPITIGDVKPFTSSYSGIAFLSHMHQDEQQTYINRFTLDAPKEWTDEHRNKLIRTLREKITEMKTSGYCAGPNVVMPGIAGIATCIPSPSPSRAPYMTLSISASEYRLNTERIRDLAPLLLKTARAMSAFIS